MHIFLLELVLFPRSSHHRRTASVHSHSRTLELQMNMNSIVVSIRNRFDFKHGPNASVHYARGDITDLVGIKRGSTTMQTGHCAAVNIHRQII